MKREIIKTADGSSTIHIPQWNENYHSKHGAIKEAYHVFIKHGLDFVCEFKTPANQIINILEIGFGTGLNAYITYLEFKKNRVPINYVGVEAYPVTKQEVAMLNYPIQLNVPEHAPIFSNMHDIPWETAHKIDANFTLQKQQKHFKDISEKHSFNLIYFDAFGARVQPELWTEAIFSKMYIALKTGGVMVTYAAKGSVRRAMQAVGFAVQKLPGPPGKREMLRAVK